MTKITKKPSLLAAAVVTAVGVASFGVNSAAAQTSGSSIVERLAERFSVSESDVQAVFDEVREERQATRDEAFSDRLQEQVDSGDLTADQQAAIEEKREELQAEKQAARDELELWAEENSVELRYLKASDERLDTLVEDGDLTQDQADLIAEKREEVQTARETTKEELQEWAEANDIELSDVFGGRKGRGGFGGRGGFDRSGVQEAVGAALQSVES